MNALRVLAKIVVEAAKRKDPVAEQIILEGE